VALWKTIDSETWHAYSVEAVAWSLDSGIQGDLLEDTRDMGLSLVGRNCWNDIH
jgi:hypothetical protein